MISCLCPTYNRASGSLLGGLRLIHEAIASFIVQDYKDAELIIVNDTPGQSLVYDNPRVKIYNMGERFPTLGQKIAYAISQAQGDLLCRWDDDDIHLPWALSYMRQRIDGELEWRASNYWFHDERELPRVVDGAGNTHVQSLWWRNVLDRIGGYPVDVSGCEDQEFNNRLRRAGIGRCQEIATDELYYIYRWGTGSQHLSGKADYTSTNPHQVHYDEIGRRPITVCLLYTSRCV